jgi:hypothetical protein
LQLPARTAHALVSIWLVLALCTCNRGGEAGDRVDGWGTGSVEHVVLLWLDEPGSRLHVDRIVEVSIELARLPGVKALRIGDPLPSDRSIVDSSYDLALVFTFANAGALADYLAHPEHRAAAEHTLGPLVARMQVYDFALRALD